MKKYFNKFWTGFTTVLCVIFAVLFYPIAEEKWGVLFGILIIMFCIVFIWAIYFILARACFLHVIDKWNKINLSLTNNNYSLKES